MKFTKMQGLGNDYVYLDATRGVPEHLPELARRISDRHFGVGSDGLICICASERADFRMRMFNADGSEGEMCGNGIRCVGKFVYDKGLTDKTEFAVETLAGLKTLELHVLDGRVDSVTVDMGKPVPQEGRTLQIMGRPYEVRPVSMGNPHAVTFLNAVEQLDLPVLGPCFECHPSFPNRTNTEFVEVLDRGRLNMRVWERGSGETLACGTGACASAVAAVLAGKTDRTVTVRLLGGELSVRWDESDGHVYMTGPAVTVFEGEWPTDER
ncbi:MAG: diaminopimelate epimerase [Pseudoflavonifractor sp.]|nr:diaminopimelate epimerase [Pseudoflavonifractor sp.]